MYNTVQHCITLFSMYSTVQHCISLFSTVSVTLAVTVFCRHVSRPWRDVWSSTTYILPSGIWRQLSTAFRGRIVCLRFQWSASVSVCDPGLINNVQNLSVDCHERMRQTLHHVSLMPSLLILAMTSQLLNSVAQNNATRNILQNT